MSYIFTDLTRRIASNKVLCDKAFGVTKNRKYDKFQRFLTSLIYKSFDKKSIAIHTGTETGLNTENQ